MNKRPINKNPLSIRLPITALVSISHRVSGVFVFLLIPGLLWMLEKSLASESSYLTLMDTLQTPWVCVTYWLFIAALVFHLLAGIRHLIMDWHIGDSLRGGRLGSWMVIGGTLLVLIGLYVMGGAA